MSYIDSSGFKYRMDSLNVSDESLLVAYDFASGSSFSNGFLSTPQWVTGSTFSGKINGPLSSFYKNSGSGFFNGSNSVTISGKIPDDDFSFLFCYEKIRSGQEVLLSSAGGTNFLSSSGLTLGVNDANKLYLEYWNPINGKNSLNYEENIGSKNLVFLSKQFGEFKLGLFDPVESSLSFSSSPAPSNGYSHSDQFIIGSGKSSFWSNGGRPFSGFFDSFYCLSGKIPNDYFISLFSGIYSLPESGGISGVFESCQDVLTLSGSGVILGTGITGYETVVTYTSEFVPTGCFNSGYSFIAGTGITGYEEKYMGLQEDGCGNFVPIYVRTPLTGLIYASGFERVCTGTVETLIPNYTNVPLTGTITGEVYVEVLSGVCSEATGYYPGSLNIDDSFISSLGFESVYSYNCEQNYKSEVFLYTGSGAYSKTNLQGAFDSVRNGYIISNLHTGNNKNLFFNNGQLMIESGWSSFVEAGVTKYNISGNYFLDGNILRSNGYAGSLDSLIYDNSDFISGESIYLNNGFSASSNFNTLFSSNYQDFSLFLNGVKLLSGIDYSNSNFLFDIPVSSVLTRINNNYISNQKFYISGSGNSFGLNGSGFFPNNSSQVYSNGLRQLIDHDYVEISRFSILSGCPTPSTNKNQFIYSFLETFWNI
jgi:hypothetical protein